MKDIELTCRYKIKRLSKDDNKVVEELCEKCSDYYILSGGVFPSKEEINDIFTDLPANKKIEDNHKAFKFWSNLEYIKIKEVKMDFKSKTHVVNIMSLQI